MPFFLQLTKNRHKTQQITEITRKKKGLFYINSIQSVKVDTRRTKFLIFRLFFRFRNRFSNVSEVHMPQPRQFIPSSLLTPHWGILLLWITQIISDDTFLFNILSLQFVFNPLLFQTSSFNYCYIINYNFQLFIINFNKTYHIQKKKHN